MIGGRDQFCAGEIRSVVPAFGLGLDRQDRSPLLDRTLTESSADSTGKVRRIYQVCFSGIILGLRYLFGYPPKPHKQTGRRRIWRR